MSRASRRDAARAEHLLDGVVHDGTALARVLSAARAPGSPREMAGLDAALAAFGGTADATSSRPGAAAPTAARTAVGTWFALKVTAIVGGVTLAGGAAFAASTGHLPLFGSEDRPAPTRSVPPSGVAPGLPVNRTVAPAAPAASSSPHASRTALVPAPAGSGAATDAAPSPAGQPPASRPTHSAHPVHTPTPRPTPTRTRTPGPRPSSPGTTRSHGNPTPPGHASSHAKPKPPKPSRTGKSGK